MKLGMTKENRTEKAKKKTEDVVSYLRAIASDERLRADMRAAIDHGAAASDRVQKAIATDGIAPRLAADTKLRKNLRAMLDDLDDARGRMGRKKTHRVRNVVIVLAGAVAALVAAPKVRRWLSERTREVEGKAGSDPVPMT